MGGIGTSNHEAPALEALGIVKRYGNREALGGVDLVAWPGQIHGLLGPNGAGKTTFMRVLLGLVRRDGGTVHLFGANQDARVGRVPDGVAGFVETPAFYPYLSGRRNLELLARLDGDGGSRATNGVEQVLERIGLALQAETAVANYSAGMRQRLGLAAALLRSPRLLFLDEPTSSLDPSGARGVRAIARRLADEGAAVVWSSHDMAEVENLCGALTVINRGRVVFSGTVGELRQIVPAAVHVLHTSNNSAAFELASWQPGMRVTSANDGVLEVSADTEALDAYVIALGRAGIAVRLLERRERSLESLFLELTGDNGGAMTRAVSRDAAEGLTASPLRQ
jgi:ABC-2 type transport system ATP-binding protein